MVAIQPSPGTVLLPRPERKLSHACTLDENWETLRTAAEPIDPNLRSRYLEDVAAACSSKGDLCAGDFRRLCHTVARRIMNGHAGGRDQRNEHGHFEQSFLKGPDHDQ
jgi:hypothetical protein